MSHVNMTASEQALSLRIDPDVQSVLAFMQQNIDSAKLVGVAQSIPGLAKLLWGGWQQGPVRTVALVLPKTGLSQSPANATV